MKRDTSEGLKAYAPTGGITMVDVNQEVNGERWVPLGVFDFTPGGGHKVVLSNDADLDVFADAVKFEQVPMDGFHHVTADAVRFTANTAEAASVRYVHPDHLGSPQKMTDAAGAVVWSAAFTPFGRPVAIAGAAENNNRFPGQYYDLESNLNYNYWRDYDPTIGRYMQSDPIGLRGGLNTYAYVGGNPVIQIDPIGLLKAGNKINSYPGTIVCNGRGGIRTHVDPNVFPPCLRPCVEVHEQVHLMDAYAINSYVCYGKPDGTIITFLRNERWSSEYVAYTAELACLRAALRDSKCRNKCKYQILGRIQIVAAERWKWIP